jgi:molecular chaperone GrpE (heat shock protein)
MSQVNEVESDFATAMQDLSAQSAAPLAKPDASLAAGLSAVLSAVHSLGQRIEALEETVLRELEPIQFKKMEREISAIRESERVNQKLFDSLHLEMIGYRDNFVRDSLQKPFIRDLLVLVDNMSALVGQFERGGRGKSSRSEDGRARDNLQNMLHFLHEILHRLEVTEIQETEKVDRTLHRVIGVEPAECEEEDGRIVQRLKRGYMWRDQVLRPEEVVAKRFS